MFEQPPQNAGQMNPMENFKVSLNLITWAISIMSVFWILMARKIGTIGPRSIGVNMFFTMFVMAILLPSCQLHSDQQAFNIGIWLMIVMYIVHLAASQRSRMRGNHVHTYHIGEPRFGRGKNGYSFEVALGLIVSAALFSAAPVFAMFVGASAICSGMTVSMLEERDRQRKFQIKDALMEQERMAQFYE